MIDIYSVIVDICIYIRKHLIYFSNVGGDYKGIWEVMEDYGIYLVRQAISRFQIVSRKAPPWSFELLICTSFYFYFYFYFFYYFYLSFLVFYFLFNFFALVHTRHRTRQVIDSLVFIISL